MSKEVKDKPVAKRGRPIGSKNRPDAQKPGRKPFSTHATASGRLPSYIHRRSDLPGSDIGLDLSTFAGRLAYLRLRDKLSQASLGNAIGRTRQMINMYESGNSFPGFDVVEQLANRLGVSPTYLMFGEHAIKVGDPTELFNVEEITYTEDGHRESGSFVIPRTLAQSYVDDIRKLKAYVLDHDAPLFGLVAGDRLFVNTDKTEFTIKNDMYVVEIGGEMEVIRYLPSPHQGMVTFINPRNKEVTMPLSNITLIGALVSTLTRC